MPNNDHLHHVVIVGGGFGGLYAAHCLRRKRVRVTLVDRRNFHLFQPLLYQVATGGLSPANIATPLRALFKRCPNTTVLMGEVVGVDVARRQLLLKESDAPPLTYDSLILATGSEFNYFGHYDWARVAPGLKTIEDAIAIRRRVLSAFEQAEVEYDPARLEHLLTFVVVGGGPTGVEMAGALAEVAHHTLHNNFRRIDPSRARIILVEAQDKVLGQFPPPLDAKAKSALEQMGVIVRTETTVTHVSPAGVTLQPLGENQPSEQLAAATVLWTAGVKASPLGAILAQAIGQSPDRSGRLPVELNLTVAGHPELFVIGDLANFSHQGGAPLPALAPVAMQQGRYVAKLIAARLAHRVLPGPFHYRDKGTMATIGRAKAVVAISGFKFSGYLAWLTWLFVHILFLIQFQNRVLVLIQWAFNYVTRGRAARLITEAPPPGEE